MEQATLPLENSAPVIAILQSLVTETTILSLRAREAHWNVQGPSFGSLHELFGDIYDFASDWADTLAERLVQQGGAASALSTTWSPSPMLGDEATLLNEVASLANHLALQIHQAQAGPIGSSDDESTKDILIELNRDLEKWIWKLESHLQTFQKVGKVAAKDPFVKTFRYQWTNLKSGLTGEREWSGTSRQEFTEDLDKWNRLGRD